MKGAPLGQVSALLANIRPGWKGLPGTNAFMCVFGLFVSYEERRCLTQTTVQKALKVSSLAFVPGMFNLV